MSRLKIYVYSDTGVSSYYLRHVVRWLRLSIPSDSNLEVTTIDANFLLYDLYWENLAALLVIPGGADRPYYEKLHGLGTARIDNYVREGGSYLGICAGAYFAASSLRFLEPNSKMYVDGRDLGFFPGCAVGPAYLEPAFSYTEPTGVRVAMLNFPNIQAHGYALFNGGCYFESARDYPEVCIEAYYLDLPDHPAAIISRRVGRGVVTLSGVHIEYLPHLCHKKDYNILQTREILEKNDQVLNRFRKELFSYLLKLECPSI
ncbi:biotin-ligase, domain family protein [Chlamydia ibidis]|uniref:Biotin-ligase, domain family protein n=2 Tax=Chlamydia ibidis TaxID=1405396 RepID=S7J496_9CHLA|nr:BPL-N domain-containing protein [Chlamydia ibidis]EPP35058.1 biotin-ligase, domain family protein [Chlamydia ibidis]EQM62646.1 putative biotin-protein ligase [Chlamydia ibidis 10-1398/6]